MNDTCDLDIIRKKSSIKEHDFVVISDRIADIRDDRLYQNLKSADASMVWERLSSGYRIVDLQLDRFIEALRFVLENFSKTEPMCKAIGLHEDAVSSRSMLHLIFGKMKENLSFCAIQDGTGDVVGVLVASIFDKPQWKFLFQYPGESLRRIMTMQKIASTRALLYQALNTEYPVRIDIICVKTDCQKEGIGTALLRTCLARVSNFASACIGEFTSAASQTIARRLQFETIYELPYQEIGSEGDEFRIFEDCYPENYSITCMAVNITPPIRQLSVITSSPSVHSQVSQKKRKKSKKKK